MYMGRFRESGCEVTRQLFLCMCACVVRLLVKEELGNYPGPLKSCVWICNFKGDSDTQFDPGNQCRHLIWFASLWCDVVSDLPDWTDEYEGSVRQLQAAGE